jgi:putative NADPH-quinone reductase
LRIALIQGHPDPAGGHFCHALADAYERSAREAGHEVRIVSVARLGLPLLRNAEEWREGPAPAEVQQTLAWAEHWVVVFPLWLGDMPAALKAFFEQTLRPGFAIGKASAGRLPQKLLKGRSARVIVTMGMPAFFYKLFYRAHSLKSLKRNMLEFVGVAPVRSTVIGMVEGAASAREAWLQKVLALGRQAG